MHECQNGETGESRDVTCKTKEGLFSGSRGRAHSLSIFHSTHAFFSSPLFVHYFTCQRALQSLECHFEFLAFLRCTMLSLACLLRIELHQTLTVDLCHNCYITAYTYLHLLVLKGRDIPPPHIVVTQYSIAPSVRPSVQARKW